ncbi:hypothetical protein EYF80_037523 [Liparis tanakae]|uniref:Uncharacterized protein n=1 Tax=Liparis tanakae TaxID=230148 RepID=A0A4Z2GFJ1_9TELE|nr:hypothetical protein EYF80_037523 [Liparis tanakae]
MCCTTTVFIERERRGVMMMKKKKKKEGKKKKKKKKEEKKKEEKKEPRLGAKEDGDRQNLEETAKAGVTEAGRLEDVASPNYRANITTPFTALFSWLLTNPS